MAEFSTKVELDLEELANLSESVIDDMLDAAAAVTVEAHKQSIVAAGLVDTGELRDSITSVKKTSKRDKQRYALVYPHGYHGSRKRARVKKRRKPITGKEKKVKNAEIGFVHEFGAPHRGIKATNWMKKANEACADDVEAAQMAVYNRHLDDLKL